MLGGAAVHPADDAQRVLFGTLVGDPGGPAARGGGPPSAGRPEAPAPFPGTTSDVEALEWTAPLCRPLPL